jgi:hypothetical protein
VESAHHTLERSDVFADDFGIRKPALEESAEVSDR